jgi:RNA polymerase sigma factor (sigma-70 family)
MAVATALDTTAMTAAGSFDAFYRRERTPLFRALALTLGETDLAADAVDEAMARAYQRWGTVSRYGNAAGWVYRVALNWAISHLRRRRRQLPAATQASVDEPQLPDPVLAEAVRSLPIAQRSVVVLRFHLDWSLDEIALALGVPAGTVKSRLSRALQTLRDTLGDDHDA